VKTVVAECRDLGHHVPLQCFGILVGRAVQGIGQSLFAKLLLGSIRGFTHPVSKKQQPLSNGQLCLALVFFPGKGTSIETPLR